VVGTRNSLLLTPAQQNPVIRRREVTADNNTEGDTNGAPMPPPTKLPSMSLSEILKRAKGKNARTTLPVVPRPGDPPTNPGTLPPASSTTNASTLPQSNTQPEPTTASASTSAESGQPQTVIIPITGPNSLEALAQRIFERLNLGGTRTTPDQSKIVTKYKPRSKAQSKVCNEKGMAKESGTRNHHLVSKCQ
jgi:hypothetical protein